MLRGCGAIEKWWLTLDLGVQCHHPYADRRVNDSPRFEFCRLCGSHRDITDALWRPVHISQRRYAALSK